MKERKRQRKPGDAPVHQSPGIVDRVRAFVRDYDFLILFVLIYLVYNTMTRIDWSGDVVPTEYLPVALIVTGTPYFDTILNMPTIGPNLAYAFPLVNGHYVSLFPIVTSVLITPVYFVSLLPLILSGTPLDYTLIPLMAKASASVIAALSCVFVYLTGKELFSRKAALVTTLVYSFATSTWAVSSTALWQHGTTELLLILLIWLIVRNERAPSKKNILFLGIVSGLFIFNRPPDVVLLIPVIGYIIWYERKNLPLYGITAALSGLPFLMYNISIFGNIFGGYKQNLPFFSAGPETVVNFAGLLIAPNVGLFVFSPVLVLSVLGYRMLDAVGSERVRRILILYGPVIVLQILVYSLFSLWDSSVAYSFGQRFLTGFLPVLAIYLGFVISDLFSATPPDSRKQAIRAAFVVLVAISVLIQATGVFLYSYYPDRSTTPERNWDVNHLIVIDCFVYGISHVDSVTVHTFPPLPDLFNYTFGPPAK